MQQRLRDSQLWSREHLLPDSFWTSLRYYSLYRLIAAALLLGATLFYGDALTLGAHNLGMFRGVSAVYLLVGVALHLGLRNLREMFNLQLTLHVCIDVLVITLLMHASGGISSGLGAMLLISLTGAGLVAPRLLTFLYASLAAIAILIEQSYRVLVLDAPTANLVQPGLLSIGFFVTAGVTGLLAQRVAINETLALQRGRQLHNQVRVNQLVIEYMDDGVLVLDGAGRVIQHNPQFLRLLGAEAPRGTDLERVFPGLAAQWRAWREAGGRAPGASFELVVRGKDIRIRPMDAGTDGEFTVLFIEDMTRAREQAQQLKLAALGRLTASIAHEIRNPLAAISHASELLAEEERNLARGRLCRIIGDNTRRLEKLVADVLQLSRRDRLATERIHLNPWLTRFLDEFAINESVAHERFNLEADRETVVEFDPEHLRQVLWNLLTNAVRHSSGAARSVVLAIGAASGEVELNVSDDGPGVPRASQGQLFEPFFTTDSKGTGLGLYIARELCAANRALLEYVDDMPGAHFRIVWREARPA